MNIQQHLFPQDIGPYSVERSVTPNIDTGEKKGYHLGRGRLAIVSENPVAPFSNPRSVLAEYSRRDKTRASASVPSLACYHIFVSKRLSD
jgi:hypothetical protein